jgi:hypothetical protein
VVQEFVRTSLAAAVIADLFAKLTDDSNCNWQKEVRMNWSGRRVLLVVAVAALVVVGAAGAVVSRSTVAPANSSLPTISGTAAVGSTVTANPGTWSGSTPITYQYQWQICGSDGGACHAIPGATTQTYKFTSGDQGNTARVAVIASNGDGSSSATSVPSARVTAAAASGPVNTAPPTIAGDPSAGGTLTASPGTWNGTGTVTFKYQWLICGADGNACHDISGATAQTYQPTKNDSGNTIRVKVTATDSSGATDTTSVPTAQLTTTSTAGCPKLAAGAQSVSVNDVASPARLQIDQFRMTTGTVITRGMTSFDVVFHVSDTCGQPVNGALVYVTGVPYNQITTPAETATDANGNVTLRFNRKIGFPAKANQSLLVLFARARKSGDPGLAGISTRRLVSLRVNLHRP